MKIGVYDQVPMKNVTSQIKQTAKTAEQKHEGMNVFQQLLMAEQLNNSNVKNGQLSSPVEEKSVSHSKMDNDVSNNDIASIEWLSFLLQLLPNDIAQAIRERLETDPSSVQQLIEQRGTSEIEQIVTEFMALLQRDGAETAETMVQHLDLPAMFQRNDDGSNEALDVGPLLTMLKKRQTQETNTLFTTFVNRSGIPLMSSDNHVNRPFVLTHAMPVQSDKIPAALTNHSLMQTVEIPIQKQAHDEAAPQLFVNGFNSMVFPQEKMPVISLHETASKESMNQQFVQQLTEIIKSGKFTQLGNGQSQLVIRLHPEHLGTLTVKLVQENGELMAKIIASSTSAKELIEANIQQIRHVIPAQHITIEKFDVFTHEPMPTYEQPFGEQRGSRDEQQQREQRQQLKQESDLHFQDSLTNELVNFEV
ncbi:flagellar hook-length control protein FliK [Thermaerobacillus caldiproteolyticus]|uniref:Flagellar hook-length control protein FliK n=1 Tax=Thermaerobacillus caldiproteolyticus TaxID=247480 RepID=A0A7V9Z4Q6_9BACL|nr:flagellar hook-length control protein FliK [Anoxybacillus caldiproteolyticus]MBA2873989.1 flagellar hook-length control protein FliK [Anoxybacillus caldiproteolyticus]